MSLRDKLRTYINNLQSDNSINTNTIINHLESIITEHIDDTLDTESEIEQSFECIVTLLTRIEDYGDAIHRINQHQPATSLLSARANLDANQLHYQLKQLNYLINKKILEKED